MRNYYLFFQRAISALLPFFILTQFCFFLLFSLKAEIFHYSSFLKSYFEFFSALFSGDITFSSLTQTNALAEKLTKVLPVTLELYFFSFLIPIFIGIPIGIIAAARAKKWHKKCIDLFCLLISSSSVVWLSVLILYFFLIPINSELLIKSSNPISGFSGFFLFDFWFIPKGQKMSFIYQKVHQLTLPLSVLSIYVCYTMIASMEKESAITLKQSYIKMALIQGESKLGIIFRHVLPNTIPKIIPEITYNLSILFSLTIIIEILFELPGIGSWIYDAYQNNDLLVLISAILTIGILITMINIIAIFIEIFLNPLKNKG